MSAGSKPSSQLSKSRGGSFNYNGQNVASSTYNKKTGMYNQSVTLGPQEQALRSQGLGGMMGALNGVNAASNWDSGKREQVANDIFNPIARELNSSYDNQADEAVNRFGAMGGLNSAGFGSYMTQNIGKNRANSLADARSGSNLQTYDIQGKELANAIQALSANNATVNNIDNTAMGFLNPAFLAGQQGMQYAQALDASAKQNRGFFGSMFGG